MHGPAGNDSRRDIPDVGIATGCGGTSTYVRTVGRQTTTMGSADAHSRYRYLAAAMLMLAALTGCGSKSPNGSSGLTSVNASTGPPGGAPSAGSTPTGDGERWPDRDVDDRHAYRADPRQAGGTQPTKVTYPKNAARLRHRRPERVRRRQPDAPARLRAGRRASATSPTWATPTSTGTSTNAIRDGGNCACLFDNDNGDRLSIDVNPTYLGKPQAVNNAFIDRTEFGMSADSQVGAFLQAWSDGNVQRMEILSTGNTASLIRKHDHADLVDALRRHHHDAGRDARQGAISNDDSIMLQVNELQARQGRTRSAAAQRAEQALSRSTTPRSPG